MKLKACAVFLLASMALAAQGLAFDGKRKGFILGGGIGGSYNTADVGGSAFSMAANLKIGHAPSESFEIYLSSSGFGLTNLIGTYLVDVACLGVTKYLKPEGKGLFLFAGIGMSVTLNLNLWEESNTTGLGLIGGVGYDIGRHWSIQGDVLYSGKSAEVGSTAGFRVTINYLAF